MALSHVRIPPTADPATRAAQLWPASCGLHSVCDVFREDEDALEALATTGALASQHLPRLFHDLAQLHATGGRPLAELDPGDVARPNTLRALLRGDARLAELLFCGMQLAAPAVACAPTPAGATLGPLESALRALAEHAPGLRVAGAIVLTCALGASGRVYRDDARPAIYVGAALPPEQGALLALHELAVSVAMTVSASVSASASVALATACHLPAERVALDAVTALLRGTPFAATQASRLAGLDVGALPPSSEVTGLTASVVARLRRTHGAAS